MSWLSRHIVLGLRIWLLHSASFRIIIKAGGRIDYVCVCRAVTLPLAGVTAFASGLFIFGANHFDFYRLSDCDLDNGLGLLMLLHGALLSARLALALGLSLLGVSNIT